MKRLLILMTVVCIYSGCRTIMPTGSKNVVQISGTIEKLGMTTFQYGTHLIKSGNITYALKSSKVNLNSFLTEEVRLKGTRVEGYPIENGPELIEVLEVDFK